MNNPISPIADPLPAQEATPPAKPVREKGQRKQEILQTMAQMLESAQWQKITTAHLAKTIGFSEAALYRHYSGKAAMFAAILDFIEGTFLTLFKQITDEESAPLVQLQLMVGCLLEFSQRNRGLTRILTGEALQNEDNALSERLQRLLIRIEEQWKTTLREAILNGDIPNDKQAQTEAVASATYLLHFVIGAWWRFSKSGFTQPPMKNWDMYWALALRAIKST